MSDSGRTPNSKRENPSPPFSQLAWPPPVNTKYVVKPAAPPPSLSDPASNLSFYALLDYWWLLLLTVGVIVIVFLAVYCMYIRYRRRNGMDLNRAGSFRMGYNIDNSNILVDVDDPNRPWSPPENPIVYHKKHRKMRLIYPTVKFINFLNVIQEADWELDSSVSESRRSLSLRSICSLSKELDMETLEHSTVQMNTDTLSEDVQEKRVSPIPRGLNDTAHRDFSHLCTTNKQDLIPGAIQITSSTGSVEESYHTPPDKPCQEEDAAVEL